MRNMSEQVEETERDAVLVEDAALIRMMGFPVLEALPSRKVPYERVDPFILVHEGRMRLSDVGKVDTKHPHRGFDNLWYVIEGSASTGHSTGPDGAIERARLSEGALLALRTGRGAWHAEGIGEDEIGEGHGDTEFRGVLFWVNLARKDKQVEPSALVLQPEQIPVRREGDAIVRVLVGEGSPVQLGTPALILDIELPEGGGVTTPVPPEFQGFAYLLEGEAAFGANRRRRTTSPARPAGARRVVRRHRGRPRNTVPAHGGAAVRRGTRVQRPVRGLDAKSEQRRTADYLTDLLPALLLAGVAIGLAAPTVQIGALSGVAGRSVGLASGLVETMREIGGAVGIAAVSTVLVARTRDAIEIVDPAGASGRGLRRVPVGVRRHRRPRHARRAGSRHRVPTRPSRRSGAVRRRGTCDDRARTRPGGRPGCGGSGYHVELTPTGERSSRRPGRPGSTDSS